MPRTEATVFYNLMSEVVFPCFSYILLVTEMALIQCGRALHKDAKSRRWGSQGSILEPGYPRDMNKRWGRLFLIPVYLEPCLKRLEK